MDITKGIELPMTGDYLSIFRVTTQAFSGAQSSKLPSKSYLELFRMDEVEIENYFSTLDHLLNEKRSTRVIRWLELFEAMIDVNNSENLSTLLALVHPHNYDDKLKRVHIDEELKKYFVNDRFDNSTLLRTSKCQIGYILDIHSLECPHKKSIQQDHHWPFSLGGRHCEKIGFIYAKNAMSQNQILRFSSNTRCPELAEAKIRIDKAIISILTGNFHSSSILSASNRNLATIFRGGIIIYLRHGHSPMVPRKLADGTALCSISTFSGGGIGDAGVEWGAGIEVISACDWCQIERV